MCTPTPKEFQMAFLSSSCREATAVASSSVKALAHGRWVRWPCAPSSSSSPPSPSQNQNNQTQKQNQKKKRMEKVWKGIGQAALE